MQHTTHNSAFPACIQLCNLLWTANMFCTYLAHHELESMMVIIGIITHVCCTFAAACWVRQADTNQHRSSGAKLNLIQAFDALMRSQWAFLH